MKILLAVDGSQPSEIAAREVASRPWPPATAVRVLYVVPTPMLPPGHAVEPAATMGPTAWPAAVDMEKATAEQASAKAKAIAEQLKERGLDVDFKLRQGDARSEIIDEAKEWPANLIVVGSQGHTGLKRWLLGSVAQSVVTHASCSVEVVRGKPE
jgi:nucleotide-binding universal stress UspA family protein